KALKETRLDPEFPHPGALLASAVEDAHRLENLGREWFDAEYLQGKWNEYDALREKEVAKLIKKLQELEYPHAWALHLTVRWFWERQEEGINIEKDEWWTLAFRRQWYQKNSGNKQNSAKENQHVHSKRVKRKSPPVN